MSRHTERETSARAKSNQAGRPAEPSPLIGEGLTWVYSELIKRRLSGEWKETKRRETLQATD